MPGRHLFVTVVVLVVLLMGGAWWAADFQAMQRSAGRDRPLAAAQQSAKGTSTPDVVETSQ